jgi:hypothetical protein
LMSDSSRLMRLCGCVLGSSDLRIVEYFTS